MPFKHYIQKLEGRLPEYPATRSKRVWRCTQFQKERLYMYRTHSVLNDYVTSDRPSNRWSSVFLWNSANNIVSDNLGHYPSAEVWGSQSFSTLAPEYQDFILAVLNNELVTDD